jgi:hypothetical protein
VRYLWVHDGASLPTEKTEIVLVTPATTSESMDSSLVKQILENQRDQRKF